MNGIPGPEDQWLPLWTVYDRPRDYPSNFVARLSLIRSGDIEVTEHLMVSTDLAALRDQMMRLGLHCMPRLPADEPHIVEVWL